jgi:hypothetical protein
LSGFFWLSLPGVSFAVEPSTEEVSVPVEQTPAEMTPAEMTPAEMTPAENTPAISAPLIVAPVVATPAQQSLTESFQVKEDETQLANWFAVRESIESPFEYSLSAGYRQDSLKWSIADGGINIASEVDWKKTVIAQLRATGKLNLGSNWLVRGIYSTGAVRSGTNQDSDYAGSDRTQEFSRSESKTGGAVRDASIGLGRKIRLFDYADMAGLYIVPLAGFSIHQQDLIMYDGRQVVPDNGAFPKLNNSYDTRWKGSWFGLDALLGLGRNLSLNATAEYHRVDYSAEANWNLRSDLAHPVSFRHVAKGHGRLLSTGVSYRFSRNFLMNATFERQQWNTYEGYDETFFSSGTTDYYTLNPVSWDSESFSIGAVYRF